MSHCALTINFDLVQNAQMKATGATLHRVHTLLNTYTFAAEVRDQRVFDWAEQKLFVFLATGKLPDQYYTAVAAC